MRQLCEQEVGRSVSSLCRYETVSEAMFDTGVVWV